MRATFFATCLGDRFFGGACADAVRLLRSLGVEVVVPAGAVCCGQPAYNAGHHGEARRVAEHTVRALAGTDPVVLPSGSCAGMLGSHVPELVGPTLRAEARALAERTFELSHFLVDVLEVTELGRGLEGVRVAYHHGCHALREVGVREEPLVLLRNAGAEVVPWTADDECCGFGGLFSVKLPAVSVGMADRKLDTLPAADRVTSADGGCLLQLSSRARARGVTSAPRFEHLASLLLEARGSRVGTRP